MAFNLKKTLQAAALAPGLILGAATPGFIPTAVQADIGDYLSQDEVIERSRELGNDGIVVHVGEGMGTAHTAARGIKRRMGVEAESYDGGTPGQADVWINGRHFKTYANDVDIAGLQRNLEEQRVFALAPGL